MKMDVEIIEALELKLAEYSKKSGVIAEHESANMNGGCTCEGKSCSGQCYGSCSNRCAGSKR